jgi:hypothetical protein
MIAQRDLSLLSNRLAERGGRRIPEAVLERDYCLSWFLIGLSRSPLRGRLAFKGGTALKNGSPPHRRAERARCRRLLCAVTSQSQLPQQGVIVGVRADPEPDDRVPLPTAHGAPATTNANRVDGQARVNRLELKPG